MTFYNSLTNDRDIVRFCRKLGDGLFLQCCEEVAALYPKIEFETMIIDNCCMQVSILTICH